VTYDVVYSPFGLVIRSLCLFCLGTGTFVTCSWSKIMYTE